MENTTNNGRFKKGFTPWNKGKKCPIISENMKGNTNTLGRKHTEQSKLKMSVSKKGMVHSEETKKKMSIAKKGTPSHRKGTISNYSGSRHHWYGRDVSGEKAPNYKKDRTTLKKSLRRSSSAYMWWRYLCKKRDKNVCRIADENCSGKLEVHHILPWRNHVELRYNVNNGITLCNHHHPRKHSEEERLSPFFQSLIETTS